MKKGTLYWITGLSGAGKTTIGTELYYSYKNQGVDNIMILDGDMLRKITGGGYSKDDRIERARKYCNLCKIATDQGISVICCTVAMYDEIREWNRKHIDRYVEVYIKVSMETLKQRDKKGLYLSNASEVAGVDVEVELPKNSDIIIENEQNNSIKEAVKRIMEYTPVSDNSFDRDVEYWNSYYQANPASHHNEESSFAREMLKIMKKGDSLIEFGCGNGRDSMFFAKNGIEVLGIDLSKSAIDMLNAQGTACKNARFVCEDFASESALFQLQYDFCYSRFTLHAISHSQEKIMLKNAYDTLKKGGKLLIEARSVNDDLYGLGECVGHNEFIYEGHYRRFILKDEIEESLINTGFEIVSSTEGKGASVTASQDPVLLRIVATKQ